ncbi:hypothetical protein ACPA9J_26645 [Pseudomonas aeruginosa]
MTSPRVNDTWGQRQRVTGVLVESPGHGSPSYAKRRPRAASGEEFLPCCHGPRLQDANSVLAGGATACGPHRLPAPRC